MWKDNVSLDVQGFFYNNNNFILKESRIVFDKDPNLNNSFNRKTIGFYFSKYKISKDCNLVNQ